MGRLMPNLGVARSRQRRILETVNLWASAQGGQSCATHKDTPEETIALYCPPSGGSVQDGGKGCGVFPGPNGPVSHHSYAQTASLPKGASCGPEFDVERSTADWTAKLAPQLVLKRWLEDTVAYQEVGEMYQNILVT